MNRAERFFANSLSPAAFVGALVFASALFALAGKARGASQAADWTRNVLPNLSVVEGCVTEACHESFYALPVRHGPNAEFDCSPCHKAVSGKHRFEEMPSHQYLCFSCHEPNPKGKPRHPDADEYCRTCHDPHGGQERFFLVKGSVKDLCMGCHADTVGGTPQHAPVASGSCLSCHELHHAAGKPLMRRARERLCIHCHTDKARGIQEGVSVHEPVTKDCTLCHEPHAGGHGEARVKQEMLDLCRGCHTEKFERIDSAQYPHKAVTEGRHCVSCHDPHFAGGRHLLKEPTRDLCLECHDRTYQLEDGYELQDVKAQLTQSRFIHGPAKQGSCNPCHDPHGSNYPRLLNYDFPCSFYAKFEESRYDLCFRCHNRKLVLESESTVTQFRNGQQNLHYLHVNQEKGRTCRACHHEHATNNPFRIRESVPYGRWQMPLTFRKKSDGGSCQNACHGEHAYNRVEPVQNLPDTPSDGDIRIPEEQAERQPSMRVSDTQE